MKSGHFDLLTTGEVDALRVKTTHPTIRSL